MSNKQYQPCPVCSGQKTVKGDTCPKCGGHGVIVITVTENQTRTTRLLQE